MGPSRRAARLKELRETSGLTLTEVAARIEINQGSLSRIENGERGTTPVLARALLECYGVDGPTQRNDVLDLVRADKEQQKSWWRKYSTVLTATRYDGYLALESGAVALSNYQPMLVPGLLQTEDYARAVIAQMGWTSRQPRSKTSSRSACNARPLDWTANTPPSSGPSSTKPTPPHQRLPSRDGRPDTPSPRGQRPADHHRPTPPCSLGAHPGVATSAPSGSDTVAARHPRRPAAWRHTRQPAERHAGRPAVDPHHHRTRSAWPTTCSTRVIHTLRAFGADRRTPTA
jgi:transcriptional regulator with XRE-family HTH domain